MLIKLKKIKNKATINENETDKKIKELSSENEVTKLTPTGTSNPWPKVQGTE